MSETVTPSATTQSSLPRVSSTGLSFHHIFTSPVTHPFDIIEWERRDAIITNEKGKVIFEQKNVEVPKSWSQTALNIVASKYFRGKLDSPERETSVKQIVLRVASTITEWGKQDKYFDSEKDSQAFLYELIYLLTNQYAAFNSPVWFNVGIEAKPQCSACFINSVEDTMDSLLELVKTEGSLFKKGSGTGTNLSTLRSSFEHLSKGGKSSGPVSFMKGFDAFAGVIKSGGATRRAAKIAILNVDHPDILEFINCKVIEEKKAHALAAAGFDPGFNIPGGAYDSVSYQNANHSVRVTDYFMQAVEKGEQWATKDVTTGMIRGTFYAKDIMKSIAEAAYACGDPGIQFDTITNEWHTCPNTARINASNPCGEYLHLDDSACNLASLNLMKFRKTTGDFDIERFKYAVDIMITAQEILVSNSSYPTHKIAANSYAFRQLGLGYANLGALLMSNGVAYDSEEGRDHAASITSLMTGEAYLQSSKIAEKKGAFDGFEHNRAPMMNVMNKHRRATLVICHESPSHICSNALDVWKEAIEMGEKVGYRNSQVTVLAPTGTIGFMMDCDTTGVEPDIALVKYKKLVGGGAIKIVNQTVPEALRKLGYSDKEIEILLHHIEENDTIEGSNLFIKDEDLSVFDCALTPTKGKRSIHYMGHVKMMAAVQPFLSGGISKTCNLPNNATVEDIINVYLESWKLGLKSITVYRDGCKQTQPLSTSIDNTITSAPLPLSSRRKLPNDRQAFTHKFSIAGHEGYFTVGLYDDGKPGEIFIIVSKEGSTMSGMMDAFATAISISLQYGVPLQVLVDKFKHMRFEPAGFTQNPDIPSAKSICDYIFSWLEKKFIHSDTNVVKNTQNISSVFIPQFSTVSAPASDAPPCNECGSLMVRSGSCYKCANCGSTSSCS